MNASGTVSIGNGVDGIRLLNAADGNTIGGSAAGAGNVISASSTYGILVWGSDNNVFQGNLIGTDVNFTVTQSVYNAYFHEPKYRPHPIQQRMVESGRLGRKSGLGFYDYREES